MDEAALGVVADPPGGKRQRGLPDLVQGDPGDLEVDGHPFHVIAVFRDPFGLSPEHRVVGG